MEERQRHVMSAMVLLLPTMLEQLIYVAFFEKEGPYRK